MKPKMTMTVDNFHMLDKKTLVLNCRAFQKENQRLREAIGLFQAFNLEHTDLIWHYNEQLKRLLPDPPEEKEKL